MDYTLALLFFLLQALSLCTAAPVSAEVLKMKSKVKGMAEQLILRLDKDFQAPPAFTLSPPADEIAGPTSIITILNGYNGLIPDNLTGVIQVKSEISSLTGYISQWRQRHCGEQRPKPMLSGPLQKLESRKDYTLTVGIEALMRVKEFLDLVLKNLDLLETC
ncbi:hypothetical protein INR49_021615 [Caranx melampygus]|nr:hypothetical protein INR49_021615 [Caranx melampygus]